MSRITVAVNVTLERGRENTYHEVKGREEWLLGEGEQ